MSAPNPHPLPTPISTSWPELMSGVISESLRVVSSHSRHFLSLSLLFLLPLSSLLLSLPSLLLLLNPHHPSSSLLRLSSPLHPSLPLPLPLLLLLPFPLLLLSAAASSSISHSVHRGFFGRPVRLFPSLSSLRSSLPRLLLTLLLLSLPLLLLSTPLLLSLLFLPSLLLPLSVLSALALLLLLSFSFSLALPIAALEPSSGLRPLLRSADLIKPMRPVPIIFISFFLPGLILILWRCGLREIRVGSDWRETVPVIVRTVLGLAGMMVLLLYWMVSSAVMYLYCKAVRGELAEEIAEEFAWEYVCLPFDEEKVPQVVSVVRQ